MPRELVDLARYGFIIEPRYYFWGWSPSSKLVLRPVFARQLVAARRLLPQGYNFKIWDGFRTRQVQMTMLESFKRRFKSSHPKWSKARLEKYLYTFGARPVRRVTRPDSHRTGGAVDLTIVDVKGRELWMGTDHDDLTDRAAFDYFEQQPAKTAMDKVAKKNRRLLKKVMLAASCKIYAPEWWHWSSERW